MDAKTQTTELKTQLHDLYGLQQIDSGLDALKKRFAALDPGRTEQTEYETAKAAYDAASASHHSTRGTQQDTELERKSVETKRSEEETKLYSGKVTHPKELQAMQEEVESLARRRNALDDKLLALMDEAQSAQSQEAETKKILTAAAGAYKAKYAQYKETAERMQAQARVLQSQRGETAKAIPPALLKRYETLRANKGGIAIAPLEDGNACGGCKMGLPSSVVAGVQEGRAIQTCQNCGRMLCEGK